ncbi:SBDS family rRNA metabolism protein, variant 1 [Aphanomyces invadans]|uniref:SBDS family rRNA metabolism protein, variant 1 n=1 Tax=Aphanomyces invadans TaxID=157072 RepID=A0A024TH31_9STRA|nr:SBDS family rRNA metabolism protein, variant 1 [Aphanomyces invadans]ETV92667.1 SBDS family rRNA metabolism protein, variant 1 [Aphanomyces invadans]|eukprot:XP_008878702.1 SBDS family rRNA metabolism protein, variant 1 [Aphanomyces invadans]
MGFLHQSQRVFTPLSQARLEHVDVVRLKKGECRFEVACFKNKLMQWRRGNDMNLEDILQSHEIFDNVSRGKRARDDDIERVFGTHDVDRVATHIMTQGQVIVSESTRAAEKDSMLREIASIIARTCVNPDTSRPHQVSAIEQAMRTMQVDVIPHQPAELQAPAIIRQLQQVMPITRAMMKVHVTVASVDVRLLQSTLKALDAAMLEQEDCANGSLRCTSLIEPGKLLVVNAFVQEHAARRFIQVVEVIPADGDESHQH